MDKQEVFNNLKEILKKSEVFIDEPMKKHTTFRIGGMADIYIKAKSVEDVKSIAKFAKQYNVPLTIIGNGSNILVGDNGIRGIVLEPDLKNKAYRRYKNFEAVTVRSRN